MSISFRCGDFVAVWKKFWNDNHLFEVEFLQHFLQLRKLSRSVGRMLCRPAAEEWERRIEKWPWAFSFHDFENCLFSRV